MKVKVNNFSKGLSLNKSEQLCGFDVAQKMENFDPSSGALKLVQGLSVYEKNELLAGVNVSGGKIFYYHKYNAETNFQEHYLVVVDSSLEAYYTRLDEVGKLTPLGVTLTSIPNAINYRLNGEDVLIFSSATDNMVVWNGVGSPEIILDAPKIKNMDLHYERLFAVTAGGDNTELKFSDDLDPTNWSESLADAGFISMVDERGGLLKVVSFNDYLYVFRENGISRVYANTGLTSSFYVNHLFTSGGEIKGDTVAVCGGVIMFLASDGFYMFDGSDAKKCLDHIFPMIEFNGNEFATYFNGCYYLACKTPSMFDDKTKNNTIIKIDLSSMAVTVLKIGVVEGFAVVNNGEDFSLVVLSSGVYKLIKIGSSGESNLPLSATWETNLSDFGDHKKRKTIRKLSIKLLNPNNDHVIVTVFNDLGQSLSVSTLGGDIEEMMLFSGSQFGYGITTRSKSISVLSVMFEIE